MQATRQRDTRAEVELRSTLHRLGLRFRVDARPLQSAPRRADIVFGPAKVAIFVDGCFWHGCPLHGTWPKANAEFWQRKIEANRCRDADTDRALAAAGWRVIRVWEHEDPRIAAEHIADLVRERRGADRRVVSPES